MYVRRKNLAGVVTRKIPDDCTTKDLFGNLVFKKQICLSCGQTKNKFEFYLESASKRKNPNQTRKQCVKCWDIFKGSTR